MKKDSKIICWALTACVLMTGFPVESYAESDSQILTVYAGPQSVSPRETIYITVEVTSSDDANIDNGTVELSFSLDGNNETQKASTVHGLVSFEVPAQKSAFENSISNLSLVTLNWIDDRGLIGRQSLQLSNGIIDHTIPCPKQISGALNLRATLNSLQFLSSDISRFCLSDEG